MIKRAKPRTVPDSPIYFESHGMHFRRPRFAICNAIAESLPASFGGFAEMTDAEVTKAMAEHEAFICATIGACWYHVDLDLDTDVRLSADTIEVYGESIADDLNELGLSVVDTLTLWSACFAQIVAHIRPALPDVVEAQKADFLERPGAASMPA